MDLVGSLVYIADEGMGLCIVDVSQPQTPVLVGRFDPDRAVRDVRVQGSFAFVASNPGIRVVDISNPASPVQVATFACPDVQNLALMGDDLYLSHFDAIRILDIQNPTAPSQLSLTVIHGRPLRVRVSGSVAYVAAYYGGLRLLDVADSSDPVEIGFFDLLGDVLGLQIRGNRAFVTGGYRPGDEKHGSEGRSSRTGDSVRRTEGLPREDGFSGLYVVDLDDPSKPAIVSSQLFGNTMDVDVSDSLACISDWGGRLGVYSIRDPDHPVQVGWAPTGYWTTDLVMDGRYAFVLLEYDLWIFDLIDPMEPALVGSIRAGTTAVDVQGRYVYLLDYYYGLSVVDIADPSAPCVVGTLDMPNWAEGISVEGDYAYVANGILGLRIIDIRNPAIPRDVGLHDTPGYAVGVTVEGGRVYVADREGGVRCFDVGDPAHPEEIGYYVTTALAEDVAVSGEEIIVGCIDGGLFVLQSHLPGSAVDNEAAGWPEVSLETVCPNPFSRQTEILFTIPSERWVRLAIQSAEGRSVARLIDQMISGGGHRVTWSGSDDRGRALPSGSYFYRLEAGDLVRTGRVVRVQ